MMTTRQAREKKAAETFRSGKARRAYALRKAILRGSTAPSGRTDAEERVCSGCRSLLDLKDVFDSFLHAGRSLRRRRAIYPKPSDVAYRDLSKQNEFLVKSVFDGKGNYLYHRNCIREVFGISNQRLSRLRKSVQTESGDPVELVCKQTVYESNRLSDVVLPHGYEEPARVYLESQPTDATVSCRKHPRRHGNARKQSNHAKSGSVQEHFLLFVDNNSASNGRKEGSYGKTYYFDRKFTQIRTPDKNDPQFQYKCKRSVLFEFNRTLTENGLGTISVGTFHNWLKKHRPYVGICPSMSDYCDTCKELQEEISRCQQIVNRLIQSGNTPEGT